MSYTVREVSAMLGLPPHRIRAWASEFLEPERGARGELRFGFHDLVILRTASELASSDLPQRKVRSALKKLRGQLPDGSSITSVRITAEGDEIVVRDGEAVWNPESGQALFDFPVSDLVEAATPILSRQKKDARSADEWFELACDLEVTDIDAAKDAYARVLKIDPEYTDAHVNLGRILHEEGAPAAAEQHYRAALDLDPEHDTALFNLGVALEDLGRLNEAVDVYRQAIDLDPKNADAHYNLAGIYERRGEKAAAFRHLKAYRQLAE